MLLLPEVEQRQTVSNLGPAENSKANEDENNDVTVNNGNEQDDGTVQDIEDFTEGNRNKVGCEIITGKNNVKKLIYEEQLLHVLKKKNTR